MNLEASPSPGRELWLYRQMSRCRGLSYRAKIMAIAFVGTHVPLIALATWFALRASEGQGWQAFISTLAVALIATLAGTGLTLYVMNQLLQPVLLTSRALRAYRETRERVPLPAEGGDEVGTLMADAARTLDHLDATLDALEHVDESTRLPNRKRFAQLVEARIGRRQPFAVAVLRFANHGRIARTLDLRQADEAACLLAERFGSRAEFGEQLARIGPAEFACILGARRSDAEPWVQAASRLGAALQAVSADLQLDAIAVKPVLHAGLAAHPEDGAGAQALIDAAIAAAAHAQPGAPVMLHSAEARRAARDRFRVEQDLRRAIERDEFELHYQPVIDVHAGRAIGAEALIRWRHPELGLLPPAVFIGPAEASGLIEPIGLWVLRHACAQVREWNDRGRGGLRVAVNLSARQFLDPALKRHVLEAIEHHGISPDQLEIELTETAAMVDHEHTRRVFTSLRDAGVGIAIDDFGTGYASMSYLHRLPFDKLKIDREFVTDVHRTRHGQAICGALIELAKGLELKVLAEGAETEPEVRYLAEHGCGLFQGYYFSRPLPADAFAQVLDRPLALVMESDPAAAPASDRAGLLH